jgi:hypothetical protein
LLGLRELFAVLSRGTDVRIALATYNSEDYQELANITLPGKVAYCQRHGYDLISGIHQGVENIGWDRIHVVANWLPKYDAVMWIDCDAVITNLTKPLTDLFQQGDQFLITADLYGINTGTFIAMNTPLTHQFLYAVRYAGPQLVKGHHWGEQEAMIRLLSMPPYDKLARFLPQNKMNSYLNAKMGRPDWFMGNFQPGDFILHLAGLFINEKLEAARFYAANAIV